MTKLNKISPRGTVQRGISFNLTQHLLLYHLYEIPGGVDCFLLKSAIKNLVRCRKRLSC